MGESLQPSPRPSNQEDTKWQYKLPQQQKHR
jgi:hypothetical protein